MESEGSKSLRPAFADTRMAQYLQKQFDALKGVVSQNDVAHALGYDKPNVVSMFKRGSTKVPLDKIPALAKALGADPALLLRFGLEQYWLGQIQMINEIFGRIVTRNEYELIEAFREVTNHSDPQIDEATLKKVAEIIKQR